ncbi:MAG TPA: YihY/virulence factor BrkB family protein [Aestuariivirga sp.]|nr:YihY/virulence factor BrkB family protein [Aestuariivirga sp.]
MSDNPVIQLPQLLREAVWRLFADEAMPLAGNIAFRMIFSIFPFLIFLTALGGFFGNDTLAQRIVDFLLEVAPDQLVSPLAPEIHRILTVPRTGLLSISAVLTIWSAMAGVDSVRVALNRAYDLKEQRTMARLYGQNTGFIIVAAFGLLAVALLIIGVPLLLAALERYAPGIRDNYLPLNLWRFPVAITLLLTGLVMAHLILPARRLPLRQILPGVGLTLVAWIIMTVAYSQWLLRFNSFASTYASLSGIFAAMFFIYLSALALILGGELNRVLALHRAQTKKAGGSLFPPADDTA